MIKQPQSLGDPCWTASSSKQTISSLAVLDETRTHYFLASHTPIQHLKDVRTSEALGENDLYQRLFDSARPEVLGVVIGAPGTGKSHLINWLKLRCDHDLALGMKKEIIPVLVRRRNGTLKDALKQIVEQLPPSMRHHLREVESAILKISDSTAREMLASFLQLELGPRRSDRDRDPLPPELRKLNEVCLSKGFRDWLCRPGGTIDKIVRQLSESRNVIELGDRVPEFLPEDFAPTKKYYEANTPDVQGIFDELEEDVEHRFKAAREFNAVLGDAIKEMTGLGGNKLRDIFDNIRMDLKGASKTLGLFIEDVSVMAVLNTEILNAVEPQAGRSDLCDMVAVIGMVKDGYDRLQANQRDRITETVSVGAAAEAWSMDSNEMARFTARYMNTMRLTDTEIRKVAESRREAGDIMISACSKCAVCDRCHEVFGKVTIGNVEVGLFPFTPVAPHKLIDSHLEHSRKTPRGYLMDIMAPLTEDTEALTDHEFPRRKLQILHVSPSYWTAFEARYCVGWSERDRSRLKLLADKWLDVTTADEARKELVPFLDPLGFDAFSQVATATGRTGSKTTQSPPPPVGTSAPPQFSKKYNDLQKALEDWKRGEKLAMDRDFRELVAEFLRNAIPWEDADIPSSEVRRLLKGYDFVRFEHMTGMSSPLFSIIFPRNSETQQLVEGLMKFVHEGKQSWDFPHAELYKRLLFNWIRKHQDKIVASLRPKSVSTDAPIRTASQYLAFAATLRRREALPAEPSEAFKALFDDHVVDPPFILGKKLGTWATELQTRSAVAREFLFDELDVPQGTGGTVFINPVPLLRILAELRAVPPVEPLAGDYFDSFWATRYQKLKLLKPYSELPMAVKEEADQICDLVEAINGFFKELGYDIATPHKAFDAFCNDLKALLEAAQRESLLPSGDEFQLLFRNVISPNSIEWNRILTLATRVAASTDTRDILTFSSRQLSGARTALLKAETFIEELEKVLNKQLAHYGKSASADKQVEIINEALDIIGGQATTKART